MDSQDQAQTETEAMKNMRLVIDSVDDALTGQPAFVGSLQEKTNSAMSEFEKAANELRKMEKRREPGMPADYEPDCDYEMSDTEPAEPPHSESDGESAAAVHYRINFRFRNRVLFDTIFVDSTTPVAEQTKDALSLLNKNEKGEVCAHFFQFLHELKSTTYKNKYLLQLGEHKMRFSERDDSLLIRQADEATVHMGTSSNAQFRGRNMVMEELRKLLALNFNVCVSIFKSERSEQMGEMKLEEYVNSISTKNLTINMDSYPNVVQIIKLYRAPINKIIVECVDNFGDITELESVCTASSLKICSGDCKINDAGLLKLEASKLEIKTEELTSAGVNSFIKKLQSQELTNEHYAILSNYKGNYVARDVLKGLDYTEYEDREAFVEKNGLLPFNVYDPILATLPVQNSKSRLAVIVSTNYFECHLESALPKPITNDFIFID